MYSVSKSEMFHRREYLAERIENLGHGRYLPVEVPAVDIYGKGKHLGLTGMDVHINPFVVEFEPGTVESGDLCPFHKLQERWKGKRELLEEVKLDLLEARGGNPTNNRF